MLAPTPAGSDPNETAGGQPTQSPKHAMKDGESGHIA
jgi:hypothetical protein